MSYSRTITGKKFSAEDIDAIEVDIEDIAHSLSQINRYNGHLDAPYSVAQHSVLVADIYADEISETAGDLLAALLHDASEAYFQDLTPALKNYLSEYKAIEKAMTAHIFKRFGVPPNIPAMEVIKVIDTKVRTDEMIERAPWFSYETRGVRNYPNQRIRAMDWWQAKDLFLTRFKEICQIR